MVDACSSRAAEQRELGNNKRRVLGTPGPPEDVEAELVAAAETSQNTSGERLPIRQCKPPRTMYY
jgi:hypothetical protein